MIARPFEVRPRRTHRTPFRSEVSVGRPLDPRHSRKRPLDAWVRGGGPGRPRKWEGLRRGDSRSPVRNPSTTERSDGTDDAVRQRIEGSGN